MWGFQFRLSSIITPKNFVWSTLSNCKLFICTFRSGRIMSLFVEQKIMNFDLSTLRDNLFVLSQTKILASSTLAVATRLFTVLPEMNKFESSANIIGVIDFETYAKSFIYIRNNKRLILSPGGLLYRYH